MDKSSPPPPVHIYSVFRPINLSPQSHSVPSKVARDFGNYNITKLTIVVWPWHTSISKSPLSVKYVVECYGLLFVSSCDSYFISTWKSINRIMSLEYFQAVYSNRNYSSHHVQLQIGKEGMLMGPCSIHVCVCMKGCPSSFLFKFIKGSSIVRRGN